MAFSNTVTEQRNWIEHSPYNQPYSTKDRLKILDFSNTFKYRIGTLDAAINCPSPIKWQFLCFPRSYIFILISSRGKAKNVPANTCGTVMNWDSTCPSDLGKSLFICEGISVLHKCISFRQIAMENLGKRNLSLPLFPPPLQYDNGQQTYSKNAGQQPHIPYLA